MRGSQHDGTRQLFTTTTIRCMSVLPLAVACVGIATVLTAADADAYLDFDWFESGATFHEVVEIEGQSYAVITARTTFDRTVCLIDITIPTSPGFESCAHRFFSNGLALNGTYGVSVVENSGLTYALAVGQNGIKMINVTDPQRPRPAGAMTFQDDFGLYRQPAVIAEISGRSYALVQGSVIVPVDGSNPDASSPCYHVLDQYAACSVLVIVDVTDPTALAHISSVVEGQGGFGPLRPIHDVVQKSGRTYVLAIESTYREFPSTPIIDISDPANPVPVLGPSVYVGLEFDSDALVWYDAAVFGSAGWTREPRSAALSDFKLFEIVKIEDRIYARANPPSASYDEGVLDITNPDNPTLIPAITSDRHAEYVIEDTNIYGNPGIIIARTEYSSTVDIEGRTYLISTAGLSSYGLMDAVLDVTDPMNPVSVPVSFDPIDIVPHPYNVEDHEMEVDGRTYRLGQDQSGNSLVVDTTDPERITLAPDGSIDLFEPNWPYEQYLEFAYSVEISEVTYAVYTNHEGEGVELVGTEGDSVRISRDIGHRVLEIASPYGFEITETAEGPRVSLHNVVVPVIERAAVFKPDGKNIEMIVEIDGRLYAFVVGGLVMDVTEPDSPVYVPNVVEHVRLGLSNLMGSWLGTHGITVTEISNKTYVLRPEGGYALMYEIIGWKPLAVNESDTEGTVVKIVMKHISPEEIGTSPWLFDVLRDGQVTVEAFPGSANEYFQTEHDAIRFQESDFSELLMVLPNTVTLHMPQITSTGSGSGAESVSAAEFSGRAYAVAVGSHSTGTHVFDISDLTEPVRTASIPGTEVELGTEQRLATAVLQVSDRVYAFVSEGAGKLWTFDIDDPANSAYAPVTSLRGGYFGLVGTRSVAEADIAGRAYAVSVGNNHAYSDDPLSAMQITDITDPKSPQPVASILSDMDGFGALSEANGVDIMKNSGRTYAVVTSGAQGGAVSVVDITDPISSRVVASVFDDQGGFDALAGASDITIMEASGRTYAVVLTDDDGAMRTIDITDPTSPKPAGKANIEHKPKKITITEVAGRTYAVTLSGGGVHLVDMRNPAAPRAGDAFGLPREDLDAGVASLFGLDVRELEYPVDFDIVEIEGRIYLLVTSVFNTGDKLPDPTKPFTPWSGALQIFDISSGKPNEVARLVSGSDGFEAVPDDGSYSVAAWSAPDKVYAIVSGYGQQMIDISDPSSPVPGAITDDIPHITRDRNIVRDVGGATYEITPWISILDVSDPWAAYNVFGAHVGRMSDANQPDPVAVASIFDDQGGFDALGGVSHIETALIGGNAYALTAGDEGVQMIDISNPSKPEAVSVVSGVKVLDMDVAELSGRYYLVGESVRGIGAAIEITFPTRPAITGVNQDEKVAGETSNIILSGRTYEVSAAASGLSVEDVTDPEMSILMDRIAALAADPAGVTDIKLVALPDGRQYAVVASLGDMGVLIIDVTNPANPVKVAAAAPEEHFRFLAEPSSLMVVKAQGKAYVLVSSTEYNGSIHVLDITDPSDPQLAGDVSGGANSFRALSGVADIDTIEVDGRLYAVVAAPDDNGVQVMDLTYLAE